MLKSPFLVGQERCRLLRTAMNPTLQSLLSLLNTAVYDLDKLYESSDVSFPSLDKASTKSDAFLRDSPEGLRAALTTIAACDRLINLARTPEENARQAAMAVSEQCIRPFCHQLNEFVARSVHS